MRDFKLPSNYYDPPDEPEGEECPKCGEWDLVEEVELIEHPVNKHHHIMVVYWVCYNPDCMAMYKENPNADLQ